MDTTLDPTQLSYSAKVDQAKLQAWASSPAGAVARTQIQWAAYLGLASLGLIGAGVYGLATRRRGWMVAGFGGGALAWFVGNRMAASMIASARASGAIT